MAVYLERVEVHGFKSFAEPTVVTFEPSITCIVGPNGSGKSNIVDAIRWVLGEQSAKSLRGSKMEDIIFAGTDQRKQMKIAEVQLVLDNSDGALPIEYHEVSIGRRVSRNGGSDYLINGSVCRLKDVEELIMDTGIGKEAYSIVGQGKIDLILSSKPTDRRELFEEAAGITKYKIKKDEASKRLKETEINLTRVDDIIQELDRQAEPLKKQAEDARKYKEYSGELQELETRLLCTNWSIYQSELDTYVKDRDRLAANLEEREHLVLTFEEKVDQLQSQLSQINIEIDEKQELYFQQKNYRENLENQVQMLREKQNSILTQKGRIQSEIGEREEQITRYNKEKEQITYSINNLQRYHLELTSSLQTSNQKVLELEQSIATNDEQIKDLKSDSMDFVSQRSQLKAELQRYEAEKLKLNQRIDELVQLRSHNDHNLDKVASNLRQAKQDLREVNDQLVVLIDQEADLKKTQDEDQKKLLDFQEKFISLREGLQSSQSRLKLLTDLERSLEGYYLGVKNVLRAKSSLSGIVGVVAELLQVDPKKEKAITSALGGGLQNIVVETAEDAKKTIAYLKRTKGGRATFLPLDIVQGKRMAEISAVTSIKGYLGIAADFVQVEERLQPVVMNLLGRIVLAEDMDAALEISKASQHRLRIVTLDGDNIKPGGSVSGGSSQRGSNLLGRAREMERLADQVANLEKEIQLTKETGQMIKERVLEQEKRLRNLHEETHQLEIKKANLSKDEEQLQKDSQYQEDLLTKVDQEFATSLERLGKLDLLLQQLQKELEILDGEYRIQATQLENIETQVKSKREQIEQIRKEATEGRIKLASFTEQENSFNSRLDQLTELSRDNSQKITSLNLEGNELELAKGELESEVQKIIQEKRVLHQEEQNLSEEVKSLKQREQDLAGACKKEEERAKSVRRKVNELTKEINKCAVKIAEFSSKLETISDQLQTEHGIDLTSISLNYEPIKEMEKAEKRIRSLKWRLRVLGAVNQGAEEEYQTLIQRLTFLKEQHEDLVKARGALDEMINELDETIKERFLNTFQKVKVEFRTIFSKLFGGGSAQLELTEPDDLLYTGIEINAQLPGKKLQKLSLMSGGEKALTALALIFAFLKVKPSPFYILDEIDAPLDDANVERFANFVREFSEIAQFVIVTHRNRTMAEADALFGVAMEESGISKLISYKFAEKAS